MELDQQHHIQKENGCFKRSYSRNELESLRFLNVEQQQRLWNQILPSLGQEYEEIATSKPRKQSSKSKFVDRPEQGLKKRKYSSEDDEFENIQKPAFMVEGEPDFDAGPPQDGMEYLRRVRWEAAHIPRVKIVKLDKSSTLTSEQTVYMPSIPDIAKCKQHLLPSKQWEDAFPADFSKLRLQLMQLDSASPAENLNISIAEHLEGVCSSSSDGPKLSKLIELDVVSRASMLKDRIKSLEDKDSLSRDDCAWLYALCAVVDTPFDADMGASLRCLLRKCAKLRSEKLDCDGEVAMLNILVTVSGKIFGQLEP